MNCKCKNNERWSPGWHTIECWKQQHSPKAVSTPAQSAWMPDRKAIAFAVKYLREVESHMMANDIDMQMGDLLPPSIVADKLESALAPIPDERGGVS